MSSPSREKFPTTFRKSSSNPCPGIWIKNKLDELHVKTVTLRVYHILHVFSLFLEIKRESNPHNKRSHPSREFFWCTCHGFLPPSSTKYPCAVQLPISGNVVAPRQQQWKASRKRTPLDHAPSAPGSAEFFWPAPGTYPTSVLRVIDLQSLRTSLLVGASPFRFCLWEADAANCKLLIGSDRRLG